MELLNLFVMAVMPVLKVLLITALGLFLALDPINLLGPDSRLSLNKIVFFVFSPSLILSNLSQTITLQSLLTLWFMPVNILLTFLIGSALAWILIKITRTPPHLQGLIIGCCSAGNLGNLLLIIIPALCEESDSPFGESSVCSTYGEAYASLSTASVVYLSKNRNKRSSIQGSLMLQVGAVYIWTYVYPIMSMYANKSNKNTTKNDSTIIITSSGETSDSYTEALLPSQDHPTSDGYPNQARLPHTRSSVRTKSFPFFTINIIAIDRMISDFVEFFQDKMIHCFKILAAKLNLKKVFAPSTIAAIVGFIIGIASPIRKILIGDSAPLRVIDTSVSLLGEAAIPCMTLILGANLLGGLKRSRVGVLLVIGVIAVRFIFLPLLGIVIVKFAHHFGLIGSSSLYQFVLLLQYALPPAMNIGTITQLFETNMSECSVIMLWTYVVAAFSLTLWITFYMWLVA
ncbi:hypothetical protein EZV62_013794 [Acer yangbiense]|uniref:Auxin efflux carrier component n=1 Tax=Acer yangbiense TaxID=1000413 RepID=A0A5C7HQA3_9ROSI|nr:hypothetical protein EZV62_013794 [Acer yangbiense]